MIKLLNDDFEKILCNIISNEIINNYIISVKKFNNIFMFLWRKVVNNINISKYDEFINLKESDSIIELRNCINDEINKVNDIKNNIIKLKNFENM